MTMSWKILHLPRGRIVALISQLEAFQPILALACILESSLPRNSSLYQGPLTEQSAAKTQPSNHWQYLRRYGEDHRATADSQQ